jgi:ATP-binding cassette subfamily C protein
MQAVSGASGVRRDLQAALRQARGGIWAVAGFSILANALMLTGPVYMLNVYDRVLPSGSVETLVALSILMVLLFAMLVVFDALRGQIVSRAVGRIRWRVERSAFLNDLAGAAGDGAPRRRALRDLDALLRFLMSPAALVLLDLPFAPMFFAAVFLFHPLLGLVALGGALLLALLALLGHLGSRAPMARHLLAAQRGESVESAAMAEAQTVQALGMAAAISRIWHAHRIDATGAAIALADRTAGFAALARGLRLLLQSVLLGAGAWLVIDGKLTGGAMVATSVLMGRGLAPVEVLAGQWSLVVEGWRGWRGLRAGAVEPWTDQLRFHLPASAPRLEVEQVTLVPPGARVATLRMVSFTLEPGEALGVIGATGSGKSTLARAVIGLWSPSGGTIRLADAPPAALPGLAPALIGYLPQRVALMEGTIAENIARMDCEADPEAIVTAARAAGVHEMIRRLPSGYDTRLGPGGTGLSGGQGQRIALARALFGQPPILVLDEPNSGLDHDGSEALNAAIRACKAAGRSVLIMSHRATAIRECDRLMVLEAGICRAIGPRDEVLRGLDAGEAAPARAPAAS